MSLPGPALPGSSRGSRLAEAQPRHTSRQRLRSVAPASPLMRGLAPRRLGELAAAADAALVWDRCSGSSMEINCSSGAGGVCMRPLPVLCRGAPAVTRLTARRDRRGTCRGSWAAAVML